MSLRRPVWVWTTIPSATGVVHELQGVATYVIALAILFAEAALLSKLWRRLPARVRRALA